VLLYAAAIVFFCFFYTALVFNSRETADNLKKSGAFIPGHPPGRPDGQAHRQASWGA
jgi:preprotein translocase subunit SecY